jgi:hypothetical protein
MENININTKFALISKDEIMHQSVQGIRNAMQTELIMNVDKLFIAFPPPHDQEESSR